MQDGVHIAQPEAELATHVFRIEIELALDVIEGGEIVAQQLEPAVGAVDVGLGEPAADAQGVGQLETDSLGLIQGVDQSTPPASSKPGSSARDVSPSLNSRACLAERVKTRGSKPRTVTQPAVTNCRLRRLRLPSSGCRSC